MKSSSTTRIFALKKIERRVKVVARERGRRGRAKVRFPGRKEEVEAQDKKEASFC